MISTYSLEQIVYDRGFDFTEVFNRDPTKRPEGNIVLAILLQPSFRRTYRFYVIKNDNSYFIVGQLKAKVAGELQIQLSKKIIAYHKDPNRKAILDILDIHDPSFNIEWHFEVSESFYNSIFKRLSKIRIPLKSSPSGLDGTTRAIYLSQTLPIYIEWWKYKETHWNELTNFTDEIFTFSLTKFNKAYLKR